MGKIAERQVCYCVGTTSTWNWRSKECGHCISSSSTLAFLLKHFIDGITERPRRFIWRFFFQRLFAKDIDLDSSFTVPLRFLYYDTVKEMYDRTEWIIANEILQFNELEIEKNLILSQHFRVSFDIFGRLVHPSSFAGDFRVVNCLDSSLTWRG